MVTWSRHSNIRGALRAAFRLPHASACSVLRGARSNPESGLVCLRSFACQEYYFSNSLYACAQCDVDCPAPEARPLRSTNGTALELK